MANIACRGRSKGICPEMADQVQLWGQSHGVKCVGNLGMCGLMIWFLWVCQHQQSVQKTLQRKKCTFKSKTNHPLNSTTTNSCNYNIPLMPIWQHIPNLHQLDLDSYFCLWVCHWAANNNDRTNNYYMEVFFFLITCPAMHSHHIGHLLLFAHSLLSCNYTSSYIYNM